MHVNVVGKVAVKLFARKHTFRRLVLSRWKLLDLPHLGASGKES